MRANKRTRNYGRWLIALFAVLAVSVGVLAQQAARRIDDNALQNAAQNKEEWISYNRDWSETRYSPLDQINAANVSKLGLAWSVDIPNVGQGTRQESTNLVSNGILYSITPFSLVYALDARTGKELWQSDPMTNRAASACCGVVNRGLALYEGKIIAPVLDGRLRALDAQTGKLIWETRVTPTNLPYTITMAPRVIKGGRVIVGASGGEYAVRGFFSAFDATTGQELWKFYTVPGDPSQPFEQPVYAEWVKTWDKDKKWWIAGGGGRSGAVSHTIRRRIWCTWVPDNPVPGRKSLAEAVTICVPIASSPSKARLVHMYGTIKRLPAMTGTMTPLPTLLLPI
jgi:quinohemoprotein ethanol dehydrogenase